MLGLPWFRAVAHFKVLSPLLIKLMTQLVYIVYFLSRVEQTTI